MKAAEFSKTHSCDQDWIDAMGEREVILLAAGQKCTYGGFPATVLRHASNGMYEVRVPGGPVTVSAGDLEI